MELLYSAENRTRRVRFLMWLFMGGAAAGLYWGVDLLQTYGTNPGDGGILAPLSARLWRASLVSVLGIAWALGMLVYGRIYIAKIEIDEARENFLIYTLNLIGLKRQGVPVSQVQVGKFHRGRMFTGRAAVDGPYYTLRIKGRTLPLILDGQGHTSDINLLREVLGRKDLEVGRRPFWEK